MGKKQMKQPQIPRWITVSGTVVQGYGVASGIAQDSPYPQGSLEMQQPFFYERGVDLSPYFLGTLNVSIAPYQVQITVPWIRIEHLEWSSLAPAETFSFVQCRLIVAQATYEGLVYYPHPETKVQHFQDPSVVEILAPKIPDITYGDAVVIDLPLTQIELLTIF